MRTEDLKRIILKMFRGNEFYGYEINKKLSQVDIEVELSRLYRVLNEMRKEDLLEYRWEKSRSGPKKRMYRLGGRGREELDRILLDAIATVHSFYGEYLQNLRPKINVFGDIFGPVTEELKGHEIIAYLTTKHYGIHEIVISYLQAKAPKGRTYFVKPKSVDIELSLDNLVSLDGTYDSIPLRDNLIDLLVTIDLPKQDLLNSAGREWNRVIKETGKIAICTPTILLQQYEDPLTIGDFVEKYEHEIIEKGEHIDKEILLSQLKKFFQKVEERNIVHMTTVVASKPLPM